MPVIINDEFSGRGLTKHKRSRLRKQRDGIFDQCQKKRVEGSIYCEEHREHRRLLLQEYHSRKRLGLPARKYNRKPVVQPEKPKPVSVPKRLRPPGIPA